MRRAWSFSALNNFLTCPKKYYHTSVIKDVREPESDAIRHGHHIHAAFERRIRDRDALPLGTRQYEPILASLAALSGEIRVEVKLAIDENFAPCEWFAKTTWARAVLDFICIQDTRALIFDWKTGRRKDSDEQLRLMAGMVFCHMGEVTEISASFLWMQEPAGQQIDNSIIKRAELPNIFSSFEPRLKRYQHAHDTTSFPAQPGGLCRRFCPVRKCPHHGE
jgi:hypothetical protein